MQITRSSIATAKGPADWFTGDVYIDTVASAAGPSCVGRHWSLAGRYYGSPRRPAADRTRS